MLGELVRQFHRLQEEIACAISSDDERAIYELDERLERTRKQIASLHLTDLRQRNQQIEFLLGLVLMGNDQLKETDAFRDVRQLISDYISDQAASGTLGRDKLLCRKIDNVSGDPVELANLLKRDCSDDLFNSNLRISLIGLDNTYQRTSCGNAVFYGRRPDDIVDRHVGDLIGAERFDKRAQAHLERCFAGKSGQYYHLLDHDERVSDTGDTTIMSCEMIPHRPDGGDVKGAVVIMRDVTLECARPGQIELVGLD